MLDFDGDLYGERLALDFVARLREQRRYDGIEPLVAQIAQGRRRTTRIGAAPDRPWPGSMRRRLLAWTDAG